MVSDIDAVIRENGPDLVLGSVNLEQWRLALMRSGKASTAACSGSITTREAATGTPTA